MNMIVKGRRYDVTPQVREYAEEKIGKVTRILNSSVKSIEVELWVEKNPSIENGQVAEVTVYTKGPVIRAKEGAPNMYAAVDLVSEKLERQFRRLKGKIVDRHNKRPPVAQIAAAEDLVVEVEEPAIVKVKQVQLEPMTAEEAILQLELLGHDFFVFSSAESETVSVLYRRNDGDYGLIEPAV